jgi:hypothetical protein
VARGGLARGVIARAETGVRVAFSIARGLKMRRQRSTKAAQDIVDSAQAVLSLELVADLAEPLARYLYARELRG